MRSIGTYTLLAAAMLFVLGPGVHAAGGGKGNGKGGGGGGGGGTPPAPEILFNSGGNIYMMDADGANPTLVLGSTGASTTAPAMTPGGRIVFNGSLASGPGIYLVNADGSGLEFVFPLASLLNGGPTVSPVPSPDGSYKILFADNTPDGYTDLFLVNLDGTGFVQLTDTRDRAEMHPSWSRSGNQVAATIISIDGITLFYDCLVHDLGLSGVGDVMVTSAYSIVDFPGSPLADTDGVWDTAWSRTQDVIAVTSKAVGYNSGEDIWLIDLTSPSTPWNLTGDSGHDQRRASWSPDDSQLVFHQRGNGPNKGVFTMDANGANRTRITSSGDYPHWL
jgi:Tol biopolymer transport system component